MFVSDSPCIFSSLSLSISLLHLTFPHNRLQVCLAKGGAHYGTVRQVCAQLLATLVEAAGQGQEANEEEEEERRQALASMYGQVMELLVLKVMLPLGEGEAALAMVQADLVLEARLRLVSGKKREGSNENLRMYGGTRFF